MSGNTLETDAIKELIRAIQDYQEGILVQKQFLLNAADACDQAMGSDAISRKKIRRLEECLKILDFATDKIIEESLTILANDLNEIEQIVEEA